MLPAGRPPGTACIPAVTESGWEVPCAKILQSTGGGSKLLSIPSVSSTFRWNAQQVARLATQKGAIYILAEAELKVSDTVVSIQ